MFYSICEIAGDNNIDLKPKSIITDFEVASRKSAKSFFPFAAMQFPFESNIIKKKTKYASDENLNLHMRLINALAFLPVDEISAYFKNLKQILDHEEIKIANWFDANYINGKITKNKRCKRKFDTVTSNQ